MLGAGQAAAHDSSSVSSVAEQDFDPERGGQRVNGFDGQMLAPLSSFDARDGADGDAGFAFELVLAPLFLETSFLHRVCDPATERCHPAVLATGSGRRKDLSCSVERP